MHYLKCIEINDSLVDELWQKVSKSGSYYSIGDGVTKNVFRRMLFESNVVLQGESILVRLEDHNDYVELHPIVFGHSVFKNAAGILGDVVSVVALLFSNKPICCIIPEGMKGTKRLAEVAGFHYNGPVERSLSGVVIRCSVFVKRSNS